MKTFATSFNRVTCAALVCFAASGVGAKDLTEFGSLTQSEFVALGKDLAAATSYKSIEPAAPLGLTGFDVSVSAPAPKRRRVLPGTR